MNTFMFNFDATTYTKTVIPNISIWQSLYASDSCTFWSYTLFYITWRLSLKSQEPIMYQESEFCRVNPASKEDTPNNIL